MKGFFKDGEGTNPLEKKHPKRERFQVFGPKKKEYDYDVPEGVQMTPCPCKAKGDGPIFCDRHQCMKSPSLQSLCKTDLRYFELWEDGNGPMQDPINKAMTAKRNEGFVLMEDPNKAPEKEGGYGFFMGDPDIPSESRGLGDTVAKITKATGIKKLTDTVFGALNKDCGCKERQSKLNKIFPYGKKKKKTKGFFE